MNQPEARGGRRVSLAPLPAHADMIASFIADRCPNMPILSAARWLLPALLLVSGQAGAATYGLDQLIARARTESPLLAVYRAEELAARAGVGTARAYPNPELEYTPGRAQGRAAGSVGGFASGLSISQPIENPALRDARIGTAQSRVDIAVAQTGAARVNLDALVARRFFDLQRIREETQAYAEDLALAEQIRQRVEVRVSTGEAPYSLWLVIICGAVGAFLGDNTAYGIGRGFATRFERRAELPTKFATSLA